MDKRKSKNAAPRSATSAEKTPKSKSDDPSPQELDHFVPWKFMELQSSQTVIINKVYQEEINPRKRYTTSSGRNSRASISSRHTDSFSTVVPFKHKTAPVHTENGILLTVYYNRANQVVEIAIKDCPFPINPKLIDTISLCLPFHTLLTKFTCGGKGLHYNIIDRIARILPLSNLTDICLDNTFVPQGNYYILLDQASTLKCLSLSKCKINDVVCQEIAKRIAGGPASKYLRVLCLSCNFITDIGAQALGNSLRTNRHIVHLNLCGNSITSDGAGHLLEPLSEFPLTKDEIREKIRIRREHLKENAAVITKHQSSKDTMIDLNSTAVHEKNKYLKIMHSPIASKTSMITRNSEVDEKLVKLGEDHVFGPSNTVYRNGCWYSTGNLTLCSLNLAYNDLDYTFLLKIVEVLSYQNDHNTDPKRTGLLRIVIQGNNLPINCEEYRKIEALLATLNNGARSCRKSRKSSELRKSRKSSESRNRRSNIMDNNSISNSSVVDPIATSSGKTKNQVNRP